MSMVTGKRLWILLIASLFVLSQLAVLGCWPDDEEEDEEDEEDEDTGDLCAIPPGDENADDAQGAETTSDDGELVDIPFE
jgi:hypothetical protein